MHPNHAMSNYQHQSNNMMMLCSSNDDTTINLNHSAHGSETLAVPSGVIGGTKLLNETTSTGIPAFPWKLHDVLEDAEKKGFTNIISWTLNGRAFKVHDQKAFEIQIMSKYFNQTQYKSFQRQLNIYNFIRITSGECKGSYTHDLLVRGKPDICRFMVRTKIKRKGSKSNIAISTSHERLNQLTQLQGNGGPGGGTSALVQATMKSSRSADDINTMIRKVMMNSTNHMNHIMPSSYNMNSMQNNVFEQQTQPAIPSFWDIQRQQRQQQ
jgi:hypothetical protein